MIITMSKNSNDVRPQGVLIGKDELNNISFLIPIGDLKRSIICIRKRNWEHVFSPNEGCLVGSFCVCHYKMAASSSSESVSSPNASIHT